MLEGMRSLAVSHMSGTAPEVAGRSADAAQSSGRRAAEARRVVAEPVAEASGISTQVNEASLAGAEFGQRGEQIEETIGVINGIADQTNLLALKAAIKAAQAGEHGVVSAVVADDVRRIAERTADATRQATECIRQIRSETGTAIEQIEAGMSRV